MRITKHLHPGKHPRHIDTQTSSVQTFLVETAAVNVNAHAGTRHQNENEKNVIERRGRVTFRPGIAKVARSVSRNEWGGGGGEIVEHRRSDGTPPRSIYFRFTKREPRVDTIATTLASRPLNTHQRWNRLRVTFFLRYWIIARGHEPNERSNANTRTDRFDFFLGKVTDSLN